jgi:hypothetical protein
MTTYSISNNADLLRNALRGNSLFSAITGAILIVASQGIANFMGIPNATLLLVLGIVIVGFAAFLFLQTRAQLLNISFGRVILVGDVLWVVASVIILAFDLFNLSNEGRWMVLIIGDIVGLFAIAEYIGLRRIRS